MFQWVFKGNNGVSMKDKGEGGIRLVWKKVLGGYWGLFGWVFRWLLGVVWMGI